ncbi:MAG: CapA family protein [Candidatus Kaiserbacteria bacterium]|nr:MAG: CapA family protein [Candidatus Kaiserbacteria bacterium]
MREWTRVLFSAGALTAAGALLLIDTGTKEYMRLGESEPQIISVLFGGDLMFDRSIRAVAEKSGEDFLFSCIDPTLAEADVVVANLEGPITSLLSKSVGSTPGDLHNTTFTFATTTAALLARHNIRVVNLGNNHIMNFGRGGLLETRAWLAGAGVRSFGDPDLPEEDRVLRADLRGIPFSFVNWSDWTPVGKPLASNGAGEPNPTVEQIMKEKEAGRVVVVYTHWGEEYVAPLPRVRTLARSFVDAGAAIVVGSHPHIVQEKEIYKGKYIYYSLGNFIFDQYFSEEVRNGLLLAATFDRGGLRSLIEIPIRLEQDRRTCLR